MSRNSEERVSAKQRCREERGRQRRANAAALAQGRARVGESGDLGTESCGEENAVSSEGPQTPGRVCKLDGRLDFVCYGEPSETLEQRTATIGTRTPRLSTVGGSDGRPGAEVTEREVRGVWGSFEDELTVLTDKQEVESEDREVVQYSGAGGRFGGVGVEAVLGPSRV